jgi:hypothetical protein
MTPVNEIAEKLRGKTLLTVEELTAISQVMKQTFSDLKSRSISFFYRDIYTYK